MRKNSVRVSLLVGALVLLTGQARADISWSGNYRIEAVRVTGADMTSNQLTKAYLLHHLVLQPKLVAADGINIYGRFDLLNNSGTDNVAGQSFGAGPNPSATQPITPATPSNVFSNNQDVQEPLLITELYATWTQEFGVFVVGRAPLRFGLGMTYSDGTGLFDHYITTRDMIGYKAVLGNLSFMPILAKVNEGRLNDEDDVSDYIMHVQYDNPETDLSLGVFYQMRVGTRSGNDAPNNISNGGTTTTAGFKAQQVNVYVGQKWNSLALGLEGGFETGSTGLTSTTTGNEVKINGFGVAADLKYQKPESKWTWDLKGGMASGDDPGTTDTYEGFVFNRNFDVGMLLFNQPLGQPGTDYLRTGVIRDTTTAASSQIDTEAVSNAVFLAPNFQHRLKDTMSWGATFVWATAHTSSFTGMSKDLGEELDLNFTYKPFEKMRWITELGALNPGDAWTAGAADHSTKLVYGITTKAAISF